MRTVVVLTDGQVPGEYGLNIRNADLVVLRNSRGLWSVWKDRDGYTCREVPFDRLPSRIKRAIPLYPKDPRGGGR
jgi:hypothetical protein